MSKKLIIIFVVNILLVIGLAIYYLFDFATNIETDDVDKVQKIKEDKNDKLSKATESHPDIQTKEENTKIPESLRQTQNLVTKSIKEVVNEPAKGPIETSKIETPDESIKSNFKIIVKDEKGNLIENAKVELIEFTPEKVIFSYITKKDGQAELPKLDKIYNKYFSLKISHRDFALKSIGYFLESNYTPNKPLVIILIKGFVVKGVVKDTNGNFLEGVDINLKTQNTQYYSKLELPVIQSKKNGVFEFPHVASGNIFFSGVGKGFLLIESKRYTVPLKEEIVLIYQKGREQTLKVTDLDGVGIAKASVVYFFDIEGRLVAMKTETDEKGNCSFLLTKERNRRLIVMHLDYNKYDSNGPYNLTETEPNSIILIKGNILSGKVIDKATAKPVPNAIIYCNSNENNSMQSSTSNSFGAFELKGLVEGERSFSVQSVGYKDIQWNKVLIESGKENIKDFELEPGKVCKLKLIDSSTKEPLASKQVYNLSDWQNKKPMVTNEKGELNLPIHEYYTQEIAINLRVNGFANFNQTISPTDEVTTIELLPGCNLQVFVKDPKGQPLDELTLNCSFNEKLGKKKGYFHASYNSINGCFELAGLPDGKADLIFNITGSAPIFESIDLILGAENKINLNLKPPYLLIFKIKSSDNSMVLSELSGKIEIQYTNDNWYSNNEYLQYNEEKKYFEYSISSDMVGTFVLKFPYHLPTAKTSININPSGVTEFDFILMKGLGFEGVIMNANGQKITDALIEIEPIQKDNNYSRWTSSDEYGNVISSSNSKRNIQNQNGKFIAYGYTSGKHQIKVTHYDYIPFVEEVELANKNILDMQIILKKGSQISGSVSKPDGTMVMNAKMDLVLQGPGKTNAGTNLNSNNKYYAGTDTKGQFIFKNIPTGKYQLVVNSASGHLENYEIIVGESQDITNLNIKLEENLELSGVIVDEKDNPLNKIWVTIRQVENNQAGGEGQYTEASGIFKFARVLNKKYAFNIYSQEGYKLETEITAMGGDNNVKLILKAPKRVLISGHVYLPDGKESANYSLSYIDVENKARGELIEPKISSTGFQGSINSDTLQMIKIIATAKGFSAGESTPFNLQQYSGQPIFITLKNKIDLELRVVDSYTRKPINLANAYLVSKLPLYRYHNSSNNQSDEKGQILMEVNSIGKATLTVRAIGYVDSSMEIDVLEKNVPIEILMGKGGIIKGQVFDNENKLIPFISVSLLSAQEKTNNDYYYQQNRNALESTSDENGYFEIKLVPVGKYFIKTESVSKIQAQGLFRGIPISIEEGKEINISLEEILSLTKFAKVNVTLTGADINKKEIKLSYAKIVNKNKLAESAVSTSNEEGKTSFLNVPLGEFIITINGFQKPITMPLTITSDQEINLDIPVE